MKHVLHSCNEENCFVCDGGLAFCEVCGGGEATLPTDCPGRSLNEAEQVCVQSGEHDYVDGKWVGKLKPDLSKLPVGVDWIIGHTNGGLTIYAQVGSNEQVFGDTVQEAIDKAVEQFDLLDL